MYIKLSKLEPQPKVIFANTVNGVWEGVERDDDGFGVGTYVEKGQFIKSPERTFDEWWHHIIEHKLIDGEWWWIRNES